MLLRHSHDLPVLSSLTLHPAAVGAPGCAGRMLTLYLTQEFGVSSGMVAQQGCALQRVCWQRDVPWGWQGVRRLRRAALLAVPVRRAARL